MTKREREVWSLVAAHLSNREIAQRLFLSVRTVESHVASLIGKLGVADRRALARHPALHSSLHASTTHDDGERQRKPSWPAASSSFVGRAAECAQLLDAVTAHRMVTATGPGGVGKTRLALRVVESFAAARRDGGFFVDLAHVADPAMVVSAVAAAAGVVAPLGGSLSQALAAALKSSDAVVVLDNCEHVIDAVRDCAAHLLEACASLSIVATSRTPLRAPFEWVFAVPGLSLAGDDDGADTDTAEIGDAVTLFVERARAAGASAALDRARVAALCASLDGMALAIELAAARCPALGLEGLIAGLDRGLRMLSTTTGGESRHRSLRDAIAWSWRLLSPPQRSLLDACSVFATWFDAGAARAITDPTAHRLDVADDLARLVDHNLLLASTDEPRRWRALETIRQFGAEQLAERGGPPPGRSEGGPAPGSTKWPLQGQGGSERSERGGITTDKVHERHLQWCASTLATLAPQPRDDAWCERVDRIALDVRVALAHAAGAVVRIGGAAAASHLAERLAEQQLLRGRPHESQGCFEQAAKLASADADRARLLRLAAGAAASRLVGNDTLRLLSQAAACSLACGDRHAAAEDFAWMVIFLRWAPGIMAVIPGPADGERWLMQAQAHADGAAAADAAIAVAQAFALPDADARAPMLIEHAISLARDARAALVESTALDVLCSRHLAHGDLALAIRETERRGDVLGRVALDASTAYHFNDYLLMACETHLVAGHLHEAADYADRLADLACYRDYPHPAIARRLEVDAMAGDFDAAVARGERFLAEWERAGRPVSGTLNVSACAMTMVHGVLGDEARRRVWIDVTRALTYDPARLAGCLPTFDALVALDRDQPDVAFACLRADIDDRALWGHEWTQRWRTWYAALWAEAAVLTGQPDAASRVERAARAARQNPIAAAIVARAADVLHGRGKAVRAHARAFARLGCGYQERRTQRLARRLGA